MGSISPLAYVIDWGWLRIGPPYIYINIDPVIVHLGPFALHWYGLMYVVAILISLYVAQGYAVRKGITQATIYRTLWWAIAAGLLGGRLYFVVQQPNFVSYYLAQPQHILATWEGGMAFFGAIFLIIPVLIWRARAEHINPLELVDKGKPQTSVSASCRRQRRLACDKLLRCKSNRVFYRLAPPPTSKRGAPWHPMGSASNAAIPPRMGNHPAIGKVRMQPGTAWRWIAGTICMCARPVPSSLSLIRVTRFGASGKKRDPRVSWFVSTGAQPIPLAEVWSLSKRRFGMEHTYRFGKQARLGTDPRLRTPEQFERWSQIVAAVHNQLVLARPIVSAVRQPWERTQRPVTPQQVRRGMATILTRLGTPARPPQPRGTSPGRRLHAVVTPAPRYPVVKKSDPKPKKRRKRAYIDPLIAHFASLLNPAQRVRVSPSSLNTDRLSTGYRKSLQVPRSAPAVRAPRSAERFYHRVYLAIPSIGGVIADWRIITRSEALLTGSGTFRFPARPADRLLVAGGVPERAGLDRCSSIAGWTEALVGGLSYPAMLNGPRGAGEVHLS